MPLISKELKPRKKVGDTVNYTIDLTSILGVKTITSIDALVSVSTDLTIANQAVNVAEIIVDGVTISIGQAIQFDGSVGTDKVEEAAWSNIPVDPVKPVPAP